MGRGGEEKNAGGNDSNNDEGNTGVIYKMSDVRLHNKKDDCWIVVNNNVYNLTKFKNKHPGGSRIINHYAGQDASEVFNAFHKDFVRVEKYAKLYHIGKIDPLEIIAKSHEKKFTSISNESVLTEDEKQLMELEMKRDFYELKNVVTDMGLFKPSYAFFILHAIQIVFFQIAGYFMLLKYGGENLFTCLLSLIFLVISHLQAIWIQHDLGHSSLFSKPYMNRYFQRFFFGCIVGASSDWWRFMHNQHHAKPNVIDKDPDVRVDPVFLLGENTQKIAKKHAEKKQKILYSYPRQHYLFPLAAAMLFPFYFQYTTLKYAFTRRIYADLATAFSMFVIHFGITLPVFQFSLVKAIAFFLTMRIIESTWFTWVAQSNHIVMDIHDDGVYDSWLHLQLKATCNLEKSPFNDWFTGHLNFQIEHHLFPTMPRHNLYKAQPLVQSLCKKHNIKYVVKPMGQAFKDIITSLKKYGDMWQEAYDELTLVG